jgi:hypothetical protein
MDSYLPYHEKDEFYDYEFSDQTVKEVYGLESSNFFVVMFAFCYKFINIFKKKILSLTKKFPKHQLILITTC